MSTFSEKLFKRYFKVEENSFLASLRMSFLFLVPVFLIGALTLTIQHFPVTAVREFLQTALNGKISDFLQLVYNATYGFAAVYLVISLSFVEAGSKTERIEIRSLAVLSSTACYFAFMGPDVYNGTVGILEYTRMANVFSALIIAVFATKLFFLLYRVFYRNKSDHTTAFVRVSRGILPLFCCVATAAAIAALISLVPEVHNFNDLVILALSKPFESIGATYFGGLLIMFLESFLWLFGIHGGNVFDSLLTSETGAFAFANGQIMTKAFVDTFVLMGGCGTTVCLLIAIFLFTKDRKKKKLCRMAVTPLIFNINELLVYGLPIVLNPVYVIPFVLTPLVSYSIAYAAIDWGLVPQIVNAEVQWTTPILVSGYQATGSVAGSVLQLVLLAVGVCIYMPFVKLDNSLTEKNESNFLDRLTEVCRQCERDGEPYALHGDNMAFHAFENDLLAKIEEDVANDKIYLQYQPQVKDGKIISAEALLRFRYGNRFVYPPLVVGISGNNGLFKDLSKAIVSKVLADLKEIQRVEPTFSIAANFRFDLILDESFRRWLVDAVLASGVNPHTFGVEITEEAKLSASADLDQAFDQLKRADMEILMDDFSMGHTSISVLQKNHFDYIKIDGNLIRQLEENERSRSIVSSIVDLGERLNFSVIAEYVETAAQRDMLDEMGCHVFQGYLYYKDLPIEQLVELVQKQKENE